MMLSKYIFYMEGVALDKVKVYIFHLKSTFMRHQIRNIWFFLEDKL